MQDDFECTSLHGLTAEKLREKVLKGAEALGGHVRSIDVSDPAVDGNQHLEAHYVPVTQAMKSLFGDPSFKGDMHYVPQPTFNEDGDRVFSGMHTGIQLTSSAGACSASLHVDVRDQRGACILLHPTYLTDWDYCHVFRSLVAEGPRRSWARVHCSIL